MLWCTLNTVAVGLSLLLTFYIKVPVSTHYNKAAVPSDAYIILIFRQEILVDLFHSNFLPLSAESLNFLLV